MVMQCLGKNCPKDYIYVAKCLKCSDCTAPPLVSRGPCWTCRTATIDLLEGREPFDLHTKVPVMSFHYHETRIDSVRRQLLEKVKKGEFYF